MKHLLTSTFVLLFASSSFGQFSIGAAAGGNVTFWKLNILVSGSSVESDPWLNYQMMVPVSYSITKYWQVRAEFGYHRRSWGISNFTDENGAPLGSGHLVHQYLEGGLLTTLHPLRKARPVYLLGGLSMSRLTPSTVMHLSKKIAQTHNLDTPFKQDNDFDATHRNQWLWNLGLGISKSFGPGKAFIEWRVQRNMSNTIKSNAARRDFTVLAMNVGYQFDLGTAK